MPCKLSAGQAVRTSRVEIARQAKLAEVSDKIQWIQFEDVLKERILHDSLKHPVLRVSVDCRLEGPHHKCMRGKSYNKYKRDHQTHAVVG